MLLFDSPFIRFWRNNAFEDLLFFRAEIHIVLVVAIIFDSRHHEFLFVKKVS